MLKICLILWGLITALAVFTPVPECSCWFCRKYRKVVKKYNNFKEKVNGYFK